ncbi:MAG TPA: redoxin domain-containing protein [Pseudobdellovibrionaceae bacterium]|nr:redoxin domain-containing protein [Pseudobdellovibrionaceae bacterium]
MQFTKETMNRLSRQVAKAGVVIALSAAFGSTALAQVKNGEAAPDFTLKSAAGADVKLSDYKGKTVVLEWFNNDCPYVKKHYDSGHMQKLQTQETAEGTVWLTIVSSAPGEQGHLEAAAAQKLVGERKAKMTAFLLDPKGEVGRRYAAKTTPHMYIIDSKGVLVYQGAIDSNSSSDPKTIAGATNYVTEALREVKAGQSVKTANTKPYGCSVKYK